MVTSRLSSKAHTTIPQAVRAALGVQAGDELAHVIQDGAVLLRRHAAATVDNPFALFSEWDSQEDAKAYASL